MKYGVTLRFLCYFLSAAFALFSLWCLLWVASSSSMAFTDCAGNYDLFAENPRCRQPHIAGLLAFASLLATIVFAFLGRRFRQ
jgi:hypothetical protein